jgi:hypothetical protein
MDWELYERQRATLVFVCVAFVCFLLLAFQRSAAVQHIKSLRFPPNVYLRIGCPLPRSPVRLPKNP